ncbi:MAG TPA: hypothetical protein VJ718_01650 [Candidatus Binataceae bacterium]|nr:hypothetical protein [Candidatus Binataceae bacterium]
MAERARRRVRRFAVFALTLVGCASPPRDFPPWSRVTRVEVLRTDNPHGDVLKEIRDPTQVARIVAFANENLTGYREPWFGEPLPAIDVAFYDRRRYVGHFGVGPEFFEIHRGMITFMSRPASERQVREIMRLINVDDGVLGSVEEGSPDPGCGTPLIGECP